ncbi:hypothetical protein O3P69_000345 [Scylla paramamosain]|uniref:Uncharacterized protein n=1 Tax=Scylla paramamosain TaxID=85552 RepID=A0AAW0UYD7_SCYPA
MRRVAAPLWDVQHRDNTTHKHHHLGGTGVSSEAILERRWGRVTSIRPARRTGRVTSIHPARRTGRVTSIHPARRTGRVICIHPARRTRG